MTDTDDPRPAVASAITEAARFVARHDDPRVFDSQAADLAAIVLDKLCRRFDEPATCRAVWQLEGLGRSGGPVAAVRALRALILDAARAEHARRAPAQ